MTTSDLEGMPVAKLNFFVKMLDEEFKEAERQTKQ